MVLSLVWPTNVPELQKQIVLGRLPLRRSSSVINQPVETRFAHQVYEATTEALFARRLTRTLRFQGWRYAVMPPLPRDQFKAVEIRFLRGHGRHDIIVGTEADAARLMAFIKAAECCLKGRAAVYEPRLLRLPDQCLDVMWLKSRRSQGLFVPLDAKRIGLMPGRAYGLKAFRRALSAIHASKGG